MVGMFINNVFTICEDWLVNKVTIQLEHYIIGEDRATKALSHFS